MRLSIHTVSLLTVSQYYNITQTSLPFFRRSHVSCANFLQKHVKQHNVTKNKSFRFEAGSQTNFTAILGTFLSHFQQKRFVFVSCSQPLSSPSAQLLTLCWPLMQTKVKWLAHTRVFESLWGHSCPISTKNKANPLNLSSDARHKLLCWFLEATAEKSAALLRTLPLHLHAGMVEIDATRCRMVTELS